MGKRQPHGVSGAGWRATWPRHCRFRHRKQLKFERLLGSYFRAACLPLSYIEDTRVLKRRWRPFGQINTCCSCFRQFFRRAAANLKLTVGGVLCNVKGGADISSVSGTAEL